MPRDTKPAPKTTQRRDDDKPQLVVTSRDQLREWLAEHHATSTGVWVVTPRSRHPSSIV